MPDECMREVANRLRRRSTLQELSETLAKQERDAVRVNSSGCQGGNGTCTGISQNKQVAQQFQNSTRCLYPFFARSQRLTRTRNAVLRIVPHLLDENYVR